MKGPLELPPGAQTTPQSQSGAAAPATVSSEARQAGEQAWGANPVDSGGMSPPDMPGNSVSRPAPAPAATATKKPFFLDFLL